MYVVVMCHLYVLWFISSVIFLKENALFLVPFTPRLEEGVRHSVSALARQVLQPAPAPAPPPWGCLSAGLRSHARKGVTFLVCFGRSLK